MANFKRKSIILATIIILVIVVAIMLSKALPSGSDETYTVQRESFESVITCKGEINSANNVEINLPEILQGQRDLRIYQFKIADIIDEGSSVKKGDYIARIDQSELMTMMRSTSQELEKKEADLKNAAIDSTVKLTQLREEITDAELDLEYNKIDLEQSVYESEAYQRKVRMNYQKAEIDINKKKRDYLLEKNKLKFSIKRLDDEVKKLKDQVALFQKAMASCTVTSPGDGILMLAKSPLENEKYKQGAYIYYFFPLIGILPDMSSVHSKVFVKEIDISKINVGDSVRISFDALEKVTLGGKITWISPVGETHKDYDMQVFSVKISLDETNPELKPAMSSNNDIILSNLDNVLTVPVTAVYNDDNKKFVYVKDGGEIRKQNVVTGPENEEKVVIEQGLSEGDQILLQPESEKIAMN